MSRQREQHCIQIDTDCPTAAGADLIAGLNPVVLHLMREFDDEGQRHFCAAMIGGLAGVISALVGHELAEWMFQQTTEGIRKHADATAKEVH